MVTRRLFMLVLGSALAPLASWAQPAKTARIGVLGLANPAAYAAQLDAFRAGLRELGYIEGRNIAIEYRWADGHYDRLKDAKDEDDDDFKIDDDFKDMFNDSSRGFDDDDDDF